MQYPVKIWLLLTLPMPMSWQISLNSSSSIQPRPLVSHRLNSASSLPAISGLLVSQNQKPQLCSLSMSIIDLLARQQISGDWRSSHITPDLEDTCSVMTSTSVLRLCPPPPCVSSHRCLGLVTPMSLSLSRVIITTSSTSRLVDRYNHTYLDLLLKAQVQISTMV